LNFTYFGGNRWSDVVVPAIFEISTLINPLGQIVMLLSRCAHIKQKMSHIRPTNGTMVAYGLGVEVAVSVANVNHAATLPRIHCDFVQNCTLF